MIINYFLLLFLLLCKTIDAMEAGVYFHGMYVHPMNAIPVFIPRQPVTIDAEFTDTESFKKKVEQFHRISYENRKDIIIEAVKHGEKPDEIQWADRFALLDAVKHNDTIFARFLIEHGANVNRPILGIYPHVLHFAGKVEIAELLIQSGAIIPPNILYHVMDASFDPQLITMYVNKGIDINYLHWNNPLLISLILRIYSERSEHTKKTKALLLIYYGIDLEAKVVKGTYAGQAWQTIIDTEIALAKGTKKKQLIQLKETIEQAIIDRHATSGRSEQMLAITPMPAAVIALTLSYLSLHVPTTVNNK